MSEKPRRAGNLILIVLLAGWIVCSCNASDPPEASSDRSVQTRITDESEETTGEVPVTEGPTLSSSEETMNSEISSVEFAEERVAQMTLEEKVGQMFFATWVSGNVPEEIENWNLGGLVLFAPDFEKSDPVSIRNKIDSYQKASAIPLLIGVDEEGGTVVRISRFTQFRAERFLSPQDLFAQGGLDAIRSDTVEKSKFLLSCGINVNLAPVCDVSTDAANFIYKRSFGQDAKATSDYVAVVVEEMKKEGIGISLKHFPGYGNNTDTHFGIAVDKRDYETFITSDFLPFLAGIEKGAGSVMVSHNIIDCMDANLPASLSPIVHRVLREELGFEGVIMTDDLSMGALKPYTGNQEAAVLAVLAGNDMLIGSAYAEQIPEVIRAVLSGEINEQIIDEAVTRILVWKMELGLIQSSVE